MSFKVRPFKSVFEDKLFEGIIDRGQFVVTFHDGNILYLDAIFIGDDERGPYAIIEPTEDTPSDEYSVIVSEDWDNELNGQPGCQISYIRRDLRQIGLVARELVSQGIDPTSVNLIGGPAYAISVYFTPDGSMDGVLSG